MAIRVMIVDDEYIVRLGISSMIDWEGYGYTICGTAKDGTDALEKIPDLKPDIILADILMEPMDGLTLLEKCAQQYPHVRFIMLSNYTDFPNVKRAMQLRACDYIFKLEINEKELLESLQNISLPKKPVVSTEPQPSIEDSFFIKHNLLESLLMGDSNSTHAKKLFDKLNKHLSFSNYHLMVLRANIYSTEGKHAFSLKRAIQNLIEQSLESALNIESLCFWYKELEFVFYIKASNQTLVDYKNLFEQISNYAKRYLGTEVIGALSSTVADITLFSQTIENTLSMLDASFYAPETHFFTHNGEYKSKTTREVLEKFAEKLETALFCRTLDECNRVLDGFFKDLFDLKLSSSALKGFIISVFEFVQLEITHKLPFTGAQTLDLDTQTVLKCTDFMQIKGYCQSFIENYFAQKKLGYHMREITLAQEYVVQNIEKRITLPEVAQYINMSDSYFSHLFKKEIGMNFVDYVNMLKIEHAKTLLRQTNLMVYEIAEQVGFDNANYFNILFKRIAGCTPGSYRENYSDSKI